jgi:predicted Zn-dependent peptidase
MENYGMVNLKNGVRVIYYRDNAVHTAYAKLILNFGGFNKRYKIDGKEYIIKDGTAHYLEHLVIEHSKDGNLFKRFCSDSLYFNGVTNHNKTCFYIDCVYHFEQHLKDLIYYINTPSFDAKDIDATKHAVIEELRNDEGKPYRRNWEEFFKNYVNGDGFESVIGTEELINSYDYDYIKNVYDAFYIPSNQTILVGGNFNLEKILKLIEDVYDSLDRVYPKVTLLTKKETSEIRNRDITLYSNKEDDKVSIVFKFNLDEFSPLEKLKLDYYRNYIIKENFSSTSNLSKFMIDNKHSMYNINTFNMNVNDYYYLFINLFIKNKELFKNKVLEVINNLSFDEESFNIWKKESIINIILKKESYKNSLLSYADNILEFNIVYNEDIEFVNELNLDELKELLKKLNLSNYGLITNFKEEE